MSYSDGYTSDIEISYLSKISLAELNYTAKILKEKKLLKKTS